MIHLCRLSFCLTAPGKWKNLTGSSFEFLFQDWGYLESFLQVPRAHLFVVTILFIDLHIGSELSGVFSPKYATHGPTTYSTWLRTDVLFDLRILETIGQAKNRLCQRKLEIVTRSSYTWVKLMSELWRFVYIASHVTLHAKPDAQKVNCNPDP